MPMVTNTTPRPLETVLVALAGCDGVIINGVALGVDWQTVPA